MGACDLSSLTELLVSDFLLYLAQAPLVHEVCMIPCAVLTLEQGC